MAGSHLRTRNVDPNKLNAAYFANTSPVVAARQIMTGAIPLSVRPPKAPMIVNTPEAWLGRLTELFRALAWVTWGTTTVVLIAAICIAIAMMTSIGESSGSWQRSRNYTSDNNYNSQGRGIGLSTVTSGVAGSMSLIATFSVSGLMILTCYGIGGVWMYLSVRCSQQNQP